MKAANRSHPVPIMKKLSSHESSLLFSSASSSSSKVGAVSSSGSSLHNQTTSALFQSKGLYRNSPVCRCGCPITPATPDSADGLVKRVSFGGCLFENSRFEESHQQEVKKVVSTSTCLKSKKINSPKRPLKPLPEIPSLDAYTTTTKETATLAKLNNDNQQSAPIDIQRKQICKKARHRNCPNALRQFSMEFTPESLTKALLKLEIEASTLGEHYDETATSNPRTATTDPSESGITTLERSEYSSSDVFTMDSINSTDSSSRRQGSGSFESIFSPTPKRAFTENIILCVSKNNQNKDDICTLPTESGSPSTLISEQWMKTYFNANTNTESKLPDSKILHQPIPKQTQLYNSNLRELDLAIPGTFKSFPQSSKSHTSFGKLIGKVFGSNIIPTNSHQTGQTPIEPNNNPKKKKKSEQKREKAYAKLQALNEKRNCLYKNLPKCDDKEGLVEFVKELEKEINDLEEYGGGNGGFSAIARLTSLAKAAKDVIVLSA
ncbi:hypothetical protein HK098_007301 [Nowakowskiella sp. JEL0407]|nr:hypothetical protein HK098_007301 [Nowakowskiella sp. JEL0407]